MTTSQLILKHLDDPEKLEGLFRDDPEGFRDSLDEALDANRDSVLLRAWRVRLEYCEAARGASHWHGLLYAVGIGLAAGALVRLPAIRLAEEWYYPRFAPLWIILSLSAILFRLASFGFTPNRVTVLGVNAIVFGHLVWVCRTYIGLVRGKVGFAAMERVVGNYLPGYGVWAAIVTFVLPWVFGFG
jgi:hypothetical protein